MLNECDGRITGIAYGTRMDRTAPVSKPTVSRLPRLSIQALGEPVLSIESTPVTRWRVVRVRELCFFLLHSGGPVHKEQIIGALWPDNDDQRDLDHALRTCIYHLRKVLGRNCVIYQNGTYMLDLSAHYEVEYDVANFRDCHASAKKALGLGDISTAKDAFLTMVDLYRGDYTQSFYSDWCIAQRDTLRQAYLEARHALARIAWEQEQFDESLGHWQHMLAIDNCLEEAHYGIMRCYLRQGKRGLALRQYQQCVKVLWDEFKIAPGSNIQKLYHHLQSPSYGTREIDGKRAPGGVKKMANEQLATA